MPVSIVLAPFVAGIGIGLLILLPGGTGTFAGFTFARTRYFRFWLLSELMQTGIWGVLAAQLWPALRSAFRLASLVRVPDAAETSPSGLLRSKWLVIRMAVRLAAGLRRWFDCVLATSTLLLVTVVPIAVFEPGSPWPGHEDWRNPVLTLLGGTLGISSIVGLWFVARAMHHHVIESTCDGSRIERFIELRQSVDLFVSSAAAVVALAVFATGMRLVAQQIGFAENGIGFTKEEFGLNIDVRGFLFSYGGYLSVLMALAYVPAHRAITRTGRALERMTLPIPTAGDRFKDWAENRDALEKALRLGIDRLSIMRVVLPVLSPFIGALVSGLLA